MKSPLIVAGVCVIISSLAPFMLLHLHQPVQINLQIIIVFLVIGLGLLVMGLLIPKKTKEAK